jgi:uncharacterized protein YjiS (DUF1127 family)
MADISTHRIQHRHYITKGKVMTLSLSAIRAPSSRSARSIPLGRYFAVWAERRALAAMPAARLRDLGITPAQAAREAARPIWDMTGTPCK